MTIRNYKRKIKSLKEAIKLDPQNAMNYCTLGIICSNIYNNNSQAASYFRKAIKLDSSNTFFYQNLGTADNNLHNHKEEVWALKKVITSDPDNFINNASCCDRLGIIYSHIHGNNQQAVLYYNQAIKYCRQVTNTSNIKYVREATYYNDLSDAYDRLHNYKKGLWALKKVIKLNPDDAFSGYYNKLGIIYSHVYGDNQQEISYYKKAIKLIRNEIATDEDVGNFDTAASESLDAATFYQNLSTADNNLHNYKEAVEALKNAIKLDNNNVSFYKQLSKIDNKLHNYKEEVWALKRLFKLYSYDDFSPEYNLDYGNLGIADYKLHNYKEASKAFKKAIRLEGSKKFLVFIKLGLNEHTLRKYTKESQVLKQLIKIDPKHSQYCQKLLFKTNHLLNSQRN